MSSFFELRLRMHIYTSKTVMSRCVNLFAGHKHTVAGGIANRHTVCEQCTVLVVVVGFVF